MKYIPEKKITPNINIFENYISIPFTITLLCLTSYIFGYGDLQIIKYWYCFSLGCFLLIRISEFVEIKYYHFLIEMCYYINIISIIIVLFDFDIKIIYPFTHGPLLLYCLIFGNAPIPDRLSRSITFVIHSYSTIVSRKIYWAKNFVNPPNNNLNTFIDELKLSIIIYMIWFIFYSIYLIKYDGKSDTMIKYMFKIEKNSQPSLKLKLLWLLTHFVTIVLSCSFGIVAKYNYWFNNFIILIMIVSGIYNVFKYYHYKHLKNI